MKHFEPNEERDPKFAEALRHAAQNGVSIKAVECHVTENSLKITKEVPIQL